MPLTDETKYLECDCHSPDHILRFMIQYDRDEDPVFPPELYTEVQLRQWRGFFKRVWVAIKYIFGYECRYGHWDCFLSEGKKEVGKLMDVCNQFMDLYKDYEERSKKEME